MNIEIINLTPLIDNENEEILNSFSKMVADKESEIGRDLTDRELNILRCKYDTNRINQQTDSR